MRQLATHAVAPTRTVATMVASSVRPAWKRLVGASSALARVPLAGPRRGARSPPPPPTARAPGARVLAASSFARAVGPWSAAVVVLRVGAGAARRSPRPPCLAVAQVHQRLRAPRGGPRARAAVQVLAEPVAAVVRPSVVAFRIPAAARSARRRRKNAVCAAAGLPEPCARRRLRHELRSSTPRASAVLHKPLTCGAADRGASSSSASALLRTGAGLAPCTYSTRRGASAGACHRSSAASTSARARDLPHLIARPAKATRARRRALRPREPVVALLLRAGDRTGSLPARPDERWRPASPLDRDGAGAQQLAPRSPSAQRKRSKPSRRRLLRK